MGTQPVSTAGPGGGLLPGALLEGGQVGDVHESHLTKRGGGHGLRCGSTSGDFGPGAFAVAALAVAVAMVARVSATMTIPTAMPTTASFQSTSNRPVDW